MATTSADSPIESAYKSVEDPADAPKHLDKILIALTDSKHSEYAFDWALKHFIQQKDIKIYLIGVAGRSSTELISGTEFYADILGEAKMEEQKEFDRISAILRMYRNRILATNPKSEVHMIGILISLT